ncbi:NAD(P)-dependent dehydrogenase (short-subunit alcohol dehydrogenase family) [Saccharomonospora amisosensis]|uniref:NAD(P)-dependent dehydrogenase (Short-subunit alcohol dehydrogenase family) n=1 Tax=Saccharomonospora amisosensis TaxID=1128677 RepID=A0A7X5UNT2_9PSEU|nr:SDR family oxidoreductase [Saccharomonospora amisosensis]NIJ11167.1 NAD(P)-dependent dehydrogenase (short-subunit alcohol dehydrogenase family) [Saccharomonospora amisosensis]
MPTSAAYLPRDLFRNKTVFITGGGSGVNLGIAKSFAAVGANIAICGRTASRLDEAAAELKGFGGQVCTAVADVRDPAAVRDALAKSLAEVGPADVLVCGAAGNFAAPAEAISSNGFRAVVEIDLLGTFHTAHAAFDQLKQTRGSVLAVSGGQAHMPFMHQSHVGAAKAGVDNLIRALALEWGHHGIRCNVIVPGPITGTEGMKRLAGVTSAATWNQMVALGRHGAPDEVGAMAVVLCSPLASYVTGARIVVDGGLELGGAGLFNQAIARDS